MEDEKILAGIQQNEAASFKILYKFYYPVVRSFVLKNNGSEADAEDVFQETMIVLLRKVPKDDFELTSSLKTYIFSIASNIWLKRLRDVNRQANVLVDEVAEEQSAKDVEVIEAQKQNLLHKALAAITNHCLTLIYHVFYTDKKREEIMAEMRYKNPHTFNNQKYKCLQQAKKAAVRK